MFSISKAFRVLSLVLVAVLVPATALAGTTGYAAAQPGQARTAGVARMKNVKLGKAKAKTNKAKAGKAKANKSRAGKDARPKLKVRKTH